MSKPLQVKAFTPVRLTEGREWIDTTSLMLLREMAQEEAAKIDKVIRGWAAVNPVVRIAEVLITEVPQ